MQFDAIVPIFLSTRTCLLSRLCSSKPQNNTLGQLQCDLTRSYHFLSTRSKSLLSWDFPNLNECFVNEAFKLVFQVQFQCVNYLIASSIPSECFKRLIYNKGVGSIHNVVGQTVNFLMKTHEGALHCRKPLGRRSVTKGPIYRFFELVTTAPFDCANSLG